MEFTGIKAPGPVEGTLPWQDPGGSARGARLSRALDCHGDLAGDPVGVVEGKEGAAGRHRGEGGVRERFAELSSQLEPEVRVALAPQDPHWAGELAERAGG